VKAGAGSIEERDLHARIDGRLPPERSEAVESYLASDPELAQKWSEYAEQREALRAAFDGQHAEPIPARLRVAPLLAELRSRRQRHLVRVAAAVLLVFLGGIGGWIAREIWPNLTSSASAMLARAVFQDAVAAHRTFSVETRHPVEVGANEEAHLVQWLSKRIGHRVIAPDLGTLGFRLIGGRLLPTEGGRPAAWFMYEDGKGIRLSCYFLSADPGRQTEFKYREQDGIGAFYWVDDGLAYAITANADRGLLLKVADLVYQQNAPDPAKAKLPPLPDKPS
jgi:anti-sigma factor RsiW